MTYKTKKRERGEAMKFIPWRLPPIVGPHLDAGAGGVHVYVCYAPRYPVHVGEGSSTPVSAGTDIAAVRTTCRTSAAARHDRTGMMAGPAKRSERTCVYRWCSSGQRRERETRGRESITSVYNVRNREL